MRIGVLYVNKEVLGRFFGCRVEKLVFRVWWLEWGILVRIFKDRVFFLIGFVLYLVFFRVRLEGLFCLS